MTDPAQTLESDDPRCVLRAFINGDDQGGWPTDDTDAFREALVEGAIADSGIGIDDDRDDPLVPGDGDYHRSAVVWASRLAIERVQRESESDPRTVMLAKAYALGFINEKPRESLTEVVLAAMCAFQSMDPMGNEQRVGCAMAVEAWVNGETEVRHA